MHSFIHSYPTAEENLAYEQWFFEHFESDCLRLWINPPSVIIGKHQATLAESNVPFCTQNNIPILRRISGGGTVYHDPGNINFSFYRKVDAQEPIDYVRNLRIIQRALRSIGYPVEINERHDLVLDGFKISGNAQHIKKGRALHHGTILYDTDIEMLRRSIKRSSGTVEHRAVKSVRSQSRNLREYSDFGDVGAFIRALVDSLHASQLPSSSNMAPSAETLQEIINERYFQDSWNFGYGPKYVLRNTVKTNGQDLKMEIEVDRGGTIVEARIDQSAASELKVVLSQLQGVKHYPAIIESFLKSRGNAVLQTAQIF